MSSVYTLKQELASALSNLEAANSRIADLEAENLQLRSAEYGPDLLDTIRALQARLRAFEGGE